MSWWSKATEAQKLAQIDGGIECGLTVAQIAMASRVGRSTVSMFAASRHRAFPRKDGRATAMKARSADLMRDRAAFARGDRVNLWGNTEPQDEFALDEIPQHSDVEAG